MAIHEKHPLWLRCTHWLNVPVVTLMVWSGLLIYWANAAYPGFFPDRFFEFFNLNSRLAEGMAIHFTLAWVFTLNGMIYLSGFIFSGHWREVLPNRTTFRDLGPTILHDLGLRKEAPSIEGKFNAGQRLAYSGAIFLGAIAVLSGLAIYKPVQLSPLRNLFLGYEGARLMHFVAMLGLVSFTFVHIIQVIRAGWGNFRSMVAGFELTSGNHLPSRLKLRTTLSFLALATFVAFFTFTWALANRTPEDDEIPATFRTVHEWNGKLWGKLYSPTRSAACHLPSAREPIRTNGDLGLTSPFDASQWKLEVAIEGGTPTILKLDQIHGLPRVDAQVEFRCIEGWSTPISYAGARFSDFMKKLGINGDYRYVGLATPDGAYYVSVDMASMLHPETVLAYELNGKPLTPEHGAPLRLVIPVKYGIKSLKRIGKIFFSNTRPPDYWAEQGYDWHSGL